MIAASNRGIAAATAGCRCTSGSDQRRIIGLPAVCPASTAASPRDRAPSPYSAQMLAFSAYRPHSTATGQRTRDHRPPRESDAVLSIIDNNRLPRCVREDAVSEHRQPRQQHAPKLPFVARERKCAFQHVAWRHTQVHREADRSCPAVKHGHNGVDIQPGFCASTRHRLGKPVPPPAPMSSCAAA